jgi:hypothetical protein
MDGEVVAALEDFELALLFEGPAQAINTLLSYTVELNTAKSPEAFDKLLQIYCSYLQRSPPCKDAAAWTLRSKATAFLTTFFNARPDLAAQLQRSWQHSLGDVILNAQDANLDDHLARIQAFKNLLPEAIAAATAFLQEGTCPCNDSTLRALLQTSLFSLSLPTTQNPEFDFELQKIFEISLASYVHGAPPLALASLMQTCFEAALETIQAAAVRSIAQLDSDSSKIYWQKAWSLLAILQKISPAACDIFWGAYASTVLQLAPLVTRHGGNHLSLSCVVKLLCNLDTASMLLQCLLANPAATSNAAAAGAVGNAGSAKSIKSAFKAAMVLLRDFPEAFVSACCDILTPAANAAFATRIEALHGKRKSLFSA